MNDMQIIKHSSFRFYLFLQSIEVINDDSNKEVQGEERTDNYKHNKVKIRNKTVLAFWLIVNLKKGEKFISIKIKSILLNVKVFA